MRKLERIELRDDGVINIYYRIINPLKFVEIKFVIVDSDESKKQESNGSVG